jgi:cold shock CspA family protein
MGETFEKREKEKKRAKEKQDKADKMKDRKAKNGKGKSLEDMMAYVDEHGNLSPTPPDPFKKKVINVEDIILAPSRPAEFVEISRKGVVTYFNEAKGYGFINDLKSQEKVFVHLNQLSEPIKERDKVTFEIERSPRGLTAIKVVKIK